MMIQLTVLIPAVVAIYAATGAGTVHSPLVLGGAA